MALDLVRDGDILPLAQQRKFAAALNWLADSGCLISISYGPYTSEYLGWSVIVRNKEGIFLGESIPVDSLEVAAIAGLWEADKLNWLNHDLRPRISGPGSPYLI